MKLLRYLIVLMIVPSINTAWKVNLGNAAGVVVVAELVGATCGVGYELLARASSSCSTWRALWPGRCNSSLFVLVVQQTINGNRKLGVLRYRAISKG